MASDDNDDVDDVDDFDGGFHKVRGKMLLVEMELNGLEEGPKTTFSFPPVGWLIRPPSQVATSLPFEAAATSTSSSESETSFFFNSVLFRYCKFFFTVKQITKVFTFATEV